MPRGGAFDGVADEGFGVGEREPGDGSAVGVLQLHFDLSCGAGGEVEDQFLPSKTSGLVRSSPPSSGAEVMDAAAPMMSGGTFTVTFPFQNVMEL